MWHTQPHFVSFHSRCSCSSRVPSHSRHIPWAQAMETMSQNLSSMVKPSKMHAIAQRAPFRDLPYGATHVDSVHAAPCTTPVSPQQLVGPPSAGSLQQAEPPSGGTQATHPPSMTSHSSSPDASVVQHRTASGMPQVELAAQDMTRPRQLRLGRRACAWRTAHTTKSP